MGRPVDRVCIQMPDDPREFFLAMPVVQDYIFQYVQEVARGFRERDYQFTFRMKDCYEKYEAALKVAKELTPEFDYTGWTRIRRDEFNCFIDFDFAAAEKIARCTGKHIVEALGVPIGSSPRKWPILPPKEPEEDRIDVLAWDNQDMACDQSAKLVEILGGNTRLHETWWLTWDSGMDVINNSSAVIGPSSVFTHLAASYHRKVVEIFPDMDSYKLYNNDGIVFYQAVIGSPITAENVLEAWRSLSSQTLDLENVDVLL